ncbi:MULTISPECIES: ABC transporter ATP-binding protein [unclassified Frankia]|uniref:ABC transporter ATP-binding protein n=1 Tax=unclassified Frankia TaxID=2632575 RepID=UPI001EF7408F|nr:MULTISPECIES: ATP-binding cassette domain-containing protein [unclassified Frankia]
MSIEQSVRAPSSASSGDPPAPPALAVRGLTYRFGGHTAVDAVDLDLAAGEILGLLGPNGAGKTTAIRAVVTLLRPAAGSVRVFGMDAVRYPIRARRLIGYVPQMLSADSGLTGRENVALFAGLFDVPRRQRRARVNEALAAMGLTDVADRLARTYSGGMVRRLELAQALVNAPRLLILDEPTVGLDPIARDSVWAHVHRLRAEQAIAVLLTTHYMEEADALCDRVALMHTGRVRVTGVPDELKAAIGARTSLEDVFRHHTGDALEGGGGGDFRDVQQIRRVASRAG